MTVASRQLSTLLAELEQVKKERDLLREELRIREESQIPVVPAAVLAELEQVKKERDEARDERNSYRRERDHIRKQRDDWKREHDNMLYFARKAENERDRLAEALQAVVDEVGTLERDKKQPLHNFVHLRYIVGKARAVLASMEGDGG